MGRFGSRIVLGLMSLGFAALAAAQGPAVAASIDFAEPVQLSLKTSAPAFDAFGRRFSLSLVNNERVLQKLSAQRKQQLAAYTLLRGSLEGAPGSWVRLTQTPAGVEGAIWDGEELYAVTRYENIAPLLVNPLDAAPGQTVVFRLSDARQALPRNFCALDGTTDGTEEATALDQYRAIVSEIEEGVFGPSLTRQIEISLIADTAFQQHESDATAAMLARLNVVEGIFSEQVGLLVLATDLRLMTPDSDPFTHTKGASLLEQLSTYRKNTPAVRARGLAHLMTGKDLDGATAGIAYVGTVCDAELGASLSQRSYGTTISALIMAHELGHNFGAHHDGEPGAACPNVGDGFIMAPSVSGYSTFSQCSLDTMQPVLASASCVTPAQFADVSVEPAVNSVSGEGGVAFTLPFTVRSSGNVSAEDATFSLTLPNSAGLVVESAGTTLGSCSVVGTSVNCALGHMATDSSALVSVVARSTASSTFNAQARVGAANDRLTSNNIRSLPVSLRSGIDAAIQVSVSASEVAVGSPMQVFADLSSLRALPVRNATVSLNLNQPVSSAALVGGTCTVNASAVSCSIAEIAAGATHRLTVQLTAQMAGSLFASGSVSATGDGDFTNNSDGASAWVQAERDVEISTPATVTDLAVGAVHEIQYTLRSRGPLATGDVALLISLPGGVVVDSLAAGVTCSQPSSSGWRCELGALASGATRTVQLRVHADSPVTGDIVATASTVDDGYLSNNSTNVQLRINHLVDLALLMASGGTGVEDAPVEGQVTLRSQGRQSATGATLTLELHAAGALKSVAIHNGAACALLSATRARCTLPTLPRNAQLHVNYTAEFAEPGDYDISFRVNAPGDTAPDNDVLARPLLVRPFLDVAVSGSLGLDGLYGGQSRTRSFTVTAGRRDLASARFVAAHSLPGLSVEAISASAADCRVDATLGGICDFTGLAAGSSATVNVTWRAADGSFDVNPSVVVSTPGDVATANNLLGSHVEIAGATDVELRVAATATGTQSSNLSFPAIQLVNGGHKAMSPRLEITLPSQFTVVSVSAGNAVCTGTSTLSCEFDTLDPAAVASVNLSVRSSVSGNFTSTVRVSAANDTNAANDSREVSLEIASVGGASLSAGDSGGGTGGGGRLEWLALVVLAGVLVRRRISRAA